MSEHDVQRGSEIMSYSGKIHDAAFRPRRGRGRS
jgi:hypothetical protein